MTPAFTLTVLAGVALLQTWMVDTHFAVNGCAPWTLYEGTPALTLAGFLVAHGIGSLVHHHVDGDGKTTSLLTAAARTAFGGALAAFTANVLANATIACAGGAPAWLATVVLGTLVAALAALVVFFDLASARFAQLAAWALLACTPLMLVAGVYGDPTDTHSFLAAATILGVFVSAFFLALYTIQSLVSAREMTARGNADAATTHRAHVFVSMLAIVVLGGIGATAAQFHRLAHEGMTPVFVYAYLALLFVVVMGMLHSCTHATAPLTRKATKTTTTTTSTAALLPSSAYYFGEIPHRE